MRLLTCSKSVRLGWAMIIACLASVFTTTLAEGSLLNLVGGPNGHRPDIMVQDIDFSYTPGFNPSLPNDPNAIGTFSATGLAWSIDFNYDSDDDEILNGAFQVNAQISNAGVLQPGGSFEIYNEVGNLILAGNLTQFGFSITNGTVLEFTATAEAGAFKDDFGSVGIIISDNQSFGLFSDGFGLTGNEMAMGDTFANIPEPGSMVVWSMGLFAALIMRRRVACKFPS